MGVRIRRLYKLKANSQLNLFLRLGPRSTPEYMPHGIEGHHSSTVQASSVLVESRGASMHSDVMELEGDVPIEQGNPFVRLEHLPCSVDDWIRLGSR